MPDIHDNRPQTRFFVLGRAGMDLAPEPAGTAIDEAASFSAALGGSAANSAVGLARQGCDAALISVVSDDPVGKFCLNQLLNYGVSTRWVAAVPTTARTSLALTEARLAKHRTLLYRNDPVDLQLAPNHVEGLVFKSSDCLVVTGTALCTPPSRDTALGLLAAARAAGAQTVLDIDYRPQSWSGVSEAHDVLARAAALCTAVIGNDDEFRLLAKPGESSLDAARALAAKCPLVVHKEGSAGLVAFEHGQAVTLGIFPVRALKPTGAGDAFLANLLGARSIGLSLRDALIRATAAAAMVVSRPHCAPAMPTPPELDEFLSANTLTSKDA